MKTYRTVARVIPVFFVVLCLVLLGIVMERFGTQEYIGYLRLQLRLEQARPALIQGMSEDEVRTIIGVPPDRVSLDVDETRSKVLIWQPRNQLGFCYRYASLNRIDPKDFMDMFLDFDRDGKLRFIYFGG